MHSTVHEAGVWRAGVTVAALALLVLGVTGCQSYTLESDITQGRLDAATPPLDGTHTATQSFIARRSYLCEVELLPAVYETPGQGSLTLQVFQPSEQRALAQQSIDVPQIRHNVPLRFTFPPLHLAAGTTYELRLEGSPGVRVGFWYSSLDAYESGELRLDGAAQGDLRFSTRHCYGLLLLLRQEAERWVPRAGLILPLLLLLLLPGYVVLSKLDSGQERDPIANLALAIAVSLSIAPVLLLWSTVAGLRWGRFACHIAFALLALYALYRICRWRFRGWSAGNAPSSRYLIGGMLVAFGLTLVLRLVQVRSLVLPAWVDSPQHVLITQLVAMHGQVPQSYEPLLPISGFAYHFGFHVDATLFAWLSGLAIPQAMLVLGQVLNAACILTTYLLGLRLNGRRLAALVAAVIVGLLSYMPAYYVSWGRYTQLTGMLLLPAVLVTTMDWIEAEPRDWRLLALAALLHTGLFLTHARVAIFAACFVAAFLAYESTSCWRSGSRARAREVWARTGALTVVALGMSGPWLLQVITALHAHVQAGGTLLGDPSYNAVPEGLLLVTRNRELMAFAAVGAAAGLLRRQRGISLLLLWCGLVALAVNPGLVGLPATNLVNNATAAIALFLPLSILGGQAFVFLWDSAPLALSAWSRTAGLERSFAPALRAALLVILAVAALLGAWGMVSVVNPDTILATSEDVAAMDWIRANTPVEAVFLINTRYWQLGIYAGTDGGYWIPQLTGRRALLPVLSYVQGTPNYVQSITDMAEVVAGARDADDSGLRAILEQEQVTHIYIGAQGTALTPHMFLGRPGFRRVYSSGAVWIFEIVQ